MRIGHFEDKTEQELTRWYSMIKGYLKEKEMVKTPDCSYAVFVRDRFPKVWEEYLREDCRKSQNVQPFAVSGKDIRYRICYAFYRENNENNAEKGKRYGSDSNRKIHGSPEKRAGICFKRAFSVSVNELLSGRRLSAEEYREAAEENLTRAIGESSFTESRFTWKEKVEFYKKKWLKEHMAVMCLWGICVFAVFAVCLVLKRESLGFGAAALMFIVGHGWRNNAMMAYVERNAFDGSGRR